jgi:hypothetical protein
MTRLDDLAGSPKEPEAPSFLVEDSMLVCQHCHLYVYEGLYFPTMELLTWVCEQGHKSFLREFRV